MSQQVLSICGSMDFFDEMETIAAELTAAGWTVCTPQRAEAGFCWEDLRAAERIQRKKVYIDAHLANIRGSTAVLIAKYPKNGTNGFTSGPGCLKAFKASARIWTCITQHRRRRAARSPRRQRSTEWTGAN